MEDEHPLELLELLPAGELLLAALELLLAGGRLAARGGRCDTLTGCALSVRLPAGAVSGAVLASHATFSIFSRRGVTVTADSVLGAVT